MSQKILVVDDEVDTCANLSDILSDLGYTVDVAYDGPSALELVKQKAYDVALLDLKMPGMDGRVKAAEDAARAIEDEIFKINQPQPHRFAIQPAGE